MPRARRSTLIMPVNVPRFVERAWSRNADSITLDLEDSVAPSEKATARTMVREGIALASRGGSDIHVRINHDTPEEDCQASVWPGLAGVTFPKAESGEEVRALVRIITRLEKERGLPQGSVEISPSIETAQGVWNAYDIASASPRVKAFGNVADADLTADLGVSIEALREVDLLAYSRGECDLAARALGLEVRGRVWFPGPTTISDFGDADTLVQAALVSHRAGFSTGSGIHPTQVAAHNQAFTPTQEEVAQAQEVVRAYEEAFARGEAYAVYRGRVVDSRVAQRARELLEFARACTEKDELKGHLMAQIRAQETR